MNHKEAKQRVEAILYNNCATMSEKIEQIAELITTVTEESSSGITQLCTNCDNHLRCWQEDVQNPQKTCCNYSHTII